MHKDTHRGQYTIRADMMEKREEGKEIPTSLFVIVMLSTLPPRIELQKMKTLPQQPI